MKIYRLNPSKFGNKSNQYEASNPVPMSTMLVKIYFIPMAAVSSCEKDLSMLNLITASIMLAVKIGYRSVTVETIKSYLPYSSVDKTLVYKGTSRNTSTFEEKLLTAKIPIFLNKYLDRPFKILHDLSKNQIAFFCY